MDRGFVRERRVGNRHTTRAEDPYWFFQRNIGLFAGASLACRERYGARGFRGRDSPILSEVACGPMTREEVQRVLKANVREDGQGD